MLKLVSAAGCCAAVRLVIMLTQLPAMLPSQLGECGVECKTVERAAQDILDEHDTDMGEVLYLVSRRCCGLREECMFLPNPFYENALF